MIVVRLGWKGFCCSQCIRAPFLVMCFSFIFHFFLFKRLPSCTAFR